MQKNKQRKLKIYAISDTHGSMKTLSQLLNIEGDIFIHAGDFTRFGSDENFLEFFTFLDQLKFKHKIVVGGNHQVMLDSGLIDFQRKQQILKKHPSTFTRPKILEQLKKRCIYLQHQQVQVEGLKIFGSPYTPAYGKKAFQYPKQIDSDIWKDIPEKLDILITHGPAHEILDMTTGNKFGGSKGLKKKISEVQPKYHIFGHIHDCGGLMKKIGNTTHMNVAKNITKITIPI